MSSFENEIQRAEQRDRGFQIYPVRDLNTLANALCCSYGIDTLPVCKADLDDTRNGYVMSMSHGTQFTPRALDDEIDHITNLSGDLWDLDEYVHGINGDFSWNDGMSESEQNRFQFVDPKKDIKRDAFVFTPRLDRGMSFDEFDDIKFKQPSKPGGLTYTPNSFSLQFMRPGLTGSSKDPDHMMWQKVKRPALYNGIDSIQPIDASYALKKRLFNAVRPFLGSKYGGLSDEAKSVLIGIDTPRVLPKAMRLTGLRNIDGIHNLIERDTMDGYDRMVPQLAAIGRAVDSYYKKRGWKGTTPYVEYDHRQFPGGAFASGMVNPWRFDMSGPDRLRPIMYMDSTTFDPFTLPFYGVSAPDAWDRDAYSPQAGLQTVDLEGLNPTWLHELMHLLQGLDTSRAYEDRTYDNNSRLEREWVDDAGDIDIQDPDVLKGYLRRRAGQWYYPDYDAGGVMQNVMDVANGVYNNGYAPVGELLSMGKELEGQNDLRRTLAAIQARLRHLYGSDYEVGPNGLYYNANGPILSDGTRGAHADQIITSGPDLYRRIFGKKTGVLDNINQGIMDRLNDQW